MQVLELMKRTIDMVATQTSTPDALARNKIEFKVGDPVTFYPYEKSTKAKVVGVDVDNSFGFGPKDERIFYNLTGRDGDALVSTTTGGSIVESKYYHPMKAR